MKRIIGIACIVVAALGGSAAVWFLYIDGAPPAPRPDLVRLPDDAPPPPTGYPTMNMMYLHYAAAGDSLFHLEKKTTSPDVMLVEKDIEYGNADGTALQLDLYRPATAEGAVPGLIFVHGGGWTEGRRSDMSYHAAHFAERGYAAASISYRFAQDAGYPAALQDTKCAIRWMRANAARLSIDPERIAVIGASAGGYLAMMAAYTADDTALNGTGGHAEQSSAVACVVELYGPVDFTLPEARVHPVITGFLRQPYEQDPDFYSGASPLHRLVAGAPPTFLLHGTIDDIVPVTQADALAEKLQELDVPYWYARIDGWPHSMDFSPALHPYVLDIVERFFEEHLIGLA